MLLRSPATLTHLHVAASAPAFSDQALARGVEAHKLKVLATRRLDGDLLRGDELGALRINVALIDLIRKQQDSVLCG